MPAPPPRTKSARCSAGQRRPNARARRALAIRACAPGARGPGERVLAWMYLGPVGHFYGVVADVIELGGRYAIARCLGRAPR